MSRLTDDERRALIERFRRERLAKGLPEYIESEELHRLVGHVLATHTTRTRTNGSVPNAPEAGPGKAGPRIVPARYLEQNDDNGTT